MKKTLLLFLSLFFLVGCSYKVDTTTLAIPTDLVKSQYSTYNINETKISTYYFKNKEGILHVSETISYIPNDEYGDMYDAFSPLKWDLDRISTESTLEKALELEVAKNSYTKLFSNKEEYIIDNDFAFKINRMIKEYEDRIQRRNRMDNFTFNILLQL